MKLQKRNVGKRNRHIAPTFLQFGYEISKFYLTDQI